MFISKIATFSRNTNWTRTKSPKSPDFFLSIKAKFVPM